MWNAYAFTNADERVIIDLGLTYTEAVRRCEAEAQFLRDELCLEVTRFGDDWYRPGLMPTLFVVEAAHDVFADRNHGLVWLPGPE